MDAPTPGKPAPSTPTDAVPPSLTQARRKVRLFVAVVLFTLWTAFMAYLAVKGKEVVLVSRPQMLVAPLVIEGEVSEDSGDIRSVRVIKVFRGGKLLEHQAGPGEPLPGTLRVLGFDHCRGWQGPGAYVLALQPARPRAEAPFALAAIPTSPGFPLRHREEATRPLIYPATPSVRRQTEEALRLAPNLP